MINKLIWLLKNSRIYKRIRSTALRLTNSYELEVSPAFLFLSQHTNGIFNRYDVVVRFMAIEEINGANNSGLALYIKMQQARNQYLASKNKRIKIEDLHQNKEGMLQNLVTSFRSTGFNPKFPLTVNSNLKLVDGSHRLACALYFNAETILVEKSESLDVDYGLDWFRNYFESDEAITIQEKYREMLKNIDLKAVLEEILHRERQIFGRGEFYQSCEEIGISGQRPTTERYKTYGLDEHLSPTHSVLDIGCNCGFFTLLIASKVKEVTGVEINQTLVDIGQVTKVYLNRQNVTYIQGSFNRLKLDQKFDFICSFAVHYWLGVDMRKYGDRLKSLLNPGGKVLLESQNVHQQDVDWEQKLKKFMQAGYDEIDSGTIKDDGIIERRFSVLRISDS